jgi:hypothetical protein
MRVRIPLPGGALTVKTYQSLNRDELNLVRRLYLVVGLYFVWHKNKKRPWYDQS